MLHGTIRNDDTVATLKQWCSLSDQCRNNVATLCCAENRRCLNVSSNITFREPSSRFASWSFWFIRTTTHGNWQIKKELATILTRYSLSVARGERFCRRLAFTCHGVGVQKRRSQRCSENSILIPLTTPSFTINWKLDCRSRKEKHNN